MNQVTPFVSRQSPAAQVYGVSLNPERLHFADGSHVEAGRTVATFLDALQRDANPDAPDDALLCPGCYMLVLFNASLFLAADNGQSGLQLARTMERAYGDLRRYLEQNPRPLDELAISHLQIVGETLDAEAVA